MSVKLKRDHLVMGHDLLSILVGLSFLLACHPKEQSSIPDKGMEDFQIEAGMQLELVAAEPVVIDPVAFCFDADGAMYVVENRGYPDPAEGGIPARKEGRIARIEDTDGDGVYDRRTDYAGELTYPNGIMAWKGGIFVTCAPDIYYLKDTNSDGVADIRKVALTGFYDTQTAQIRMSHPTLGLDGWVYVTGGLNGGEIVSPEHPEHPKVSYQTGDGRFHPETYEFQVTGGKSQFGLSIDPFGRRFGCSNRHPVQHIVIEPNHLTRNPYLLFTETVKNVSPVQEDAVVYPISNAATTADFIPKLIGRSHKGTFTSASGILIYADQALGADHQGNVFICESAQNLVQRQIVQADGVSFQSALAVDGQEFLASKDEWFRPVFLAHGPDGGLYIADMHRKVIDHPAYVPEEIRGDLDFDSGRDMGRIYRVIAEDYMKRSDRSRITAASSSRAFCELLASSLEWERSLAHRLLLERKDSSVISLLKDQVLNAPLPETRVRALWLLHSLKGLDSKTASIALLDQAAVVREQAVHLTARLTPLDDDSKTAILALSADPDRRVRFVTSLELGSWPGENVVRALAEIAVKDGADPWSRAAVLSGIGDRMTEFLTAFQRTYPEDSAAFTQVMMDLGKMFGAGASLAGCASLLRGILHARDRGGWRIGAALGLAEGMSVRTEPDLMNQKYRWLSIPGATVLEAERLALSRFIQEVIELAADEKMGADRRKDAIALLGHIPPGQSFPVLKELLMLHQHPELQMEVVKALTRQGEISGAGILTSKEFWVTYTPQVRAMVVARLIAQPDYLPVLFKAIEDGTITAGEIGSSDRERLLNHKISDIREQSKLLFHDLESGNRMQVYETYREIVKNSGDPNAGRQVFNRVCASCHSYNGEGGRVGPDLTGVKNQPSDALLLHTLVPNYEVYPAYQAMTIETSSGETLTGLIGSETDHSLTLRTSTGEDIVLPRTHISSLTTMGRSLMPDGLEQMMTKEDIRDLITFLRSADHLQ
jgi:putative membrane-bound dehydrogenase-like protein